MVVDELGWAHLSSESPLTAGGNGRDKGLVGAGIEWVLFDLDGTLRHNQPDGMSTFYQFAREHGLALDVEAERAARRWNFSYWASSEELRQDSRTAGDDRTGFYQLYTRRHLEQLGAEEGLDELAEQLHGRMMDEYEPEDHVPEDVLPTLSRLRSQGYRLGLLTNRDRLKPETIARLSLEGAFEFTVAAGEVGWWKPDPRIFEYVVEQAGASPKSSVYIGDNPYADVAGASAAGLHSILVDPHGLFPRVGCPVIKELGELPQLLAA